MCVLLVMLQTKRRKKKAHTHTHRHTHMTYKITKMQYNQRLHRIDTLHTIFKRYYTIQPYRQRRGDVTLCGVHIVSAYYVCLLAIYIKQAKQHRTKPNGLLYLHRKYCGACCRRRCQSFELDEFRVYEFQKLFFSFLLSLSTTALCLLHGHSYLLNVRQFVYRVLDGLRFSVCVCVVSLLLFVLLVNRFLCSHFAVLHSISHKSSNCKCFFHVHAFLVMFSISNKANKSLHNSNVEPHWKAECKTYYASDQTTIQFTKHICELLR